jgi:hypothetical protein
MATGQLKREKRFDINSEPVFVYYREGASRELYRDRDEDADFWLFDGDTDKLVGKFETLTELENKVKEIL